MPELLHPGLLWASALALPLIVLYVLKARRSRRTVSSTWLWQEDHTARAAGGRARRPPRDWLLWLELLILALLVTAAAAPYRRVQTAPGGVTAVVVDASASMLAGGRFDEARRAAARFVDALGPGDRMVLVRAAATAEVLVPSTGDRARLREALDALRPSASPGRLRPAVELAASLAGGEDAVVVIADAAADPGVDGVRVIRVGGDGDGGNAGIVALGVSPADPSGRRHEVFVRLTNASATAAGGRLRLLLDGDLRDAAAVEIPPGGEAGRTLQLVDAAGGLIEVEWSPEASTVDSLAADDRATWVLRSPPPRRYRLPGAVDPFLRRALAADPGWLPAGSGEAADLEIVFQETPAADGPPLLWIDPGAGRLEAMEGATVLSWDRTHPALRFVELRAVRFGRLHRFERPPGARVLAETSAGPLILDARVGERRALLWNFDPADSDLPLRAAFPLLVHNALEFLAPVDGGLPGGVATGAARPVRWPASGEVRLRAPGGDELPLTVEAGVLRLPPLEEAGVWTLDDGDRRVSFGASLLDAAESDLRPAAAPAAAAGGSASGRRLESEAALRGVWRPLALLALGVLLFEGAAFHRRWTP